ncbi:MAG: glycosyltransferase family 2 protein [Chloroflexota bacterium]
MAVVAPSGRRGHRVMEAPRASVVIPNWDGRTLLEECLSAVLASDTDGGLEVIVIDNGSTDGSADMVRRRFPRVLVERNDANHGFAAACNQGARMASAASVAFLNNDARVGQGWLEPLLDTLGTEADVAAVGSLVLSADGRTIDFGRAGLTPLARGTQLDFGRPAEEAPDRPTELLFANGAAMLVRRDVFLEVGGFDERFFAYYEDVDLGWRYWLLGWRLMLQPASRVFHRHHGTSRRLRKEQVDFLLTRNAIASAVKNTEDATFARLIPILLLGETARLVADVGRPDRYHVPGFGRFAFRQPPEPSMATAIRQRVGGEALRAYRHESTLRSRLARTIDRRLDPGGARLSAGAGAVTAALEEVLWGWPQLMTSRAAIQAGRRRADREIAALFGLDRQRRHRRRDAIAPDESREAVFRALEAADLDWLLPTG